MSIKFYNIIKHELNEWIIQLIEVLPNLLFAIIVFLIFYFISRALKNLSLKLLNRFTDHVALNQLISTIFSVILFTVGLFIALDILGLDKMVTSLLAGAGIVGLAISFAFQDLASNFIAGVLIAIRKPYRIRHVVKSQDVYGTVTEINLRATHIQSPQGEIIIVPNRQIFQSPIYNYSKTNSKRIELLVGISYGDDLEKVKEITTEAVKKVKNLQEDKEIGFYFQEFGNSSINFVVWFWIDFFKPVDLFQPISEAIMHIKKAYDENDIMIPFPIRTLDFGIKGGEKLNEMVEFDDIAKALSANKEKPKANEE